MRKRSKSAHIVQCFMVSIGLCATTNPASAMPDMDLLPGRIKAETAIRTQDSELAKARLSVSGGAEVKLSRKSKITAKLRLEAADDDTGLGTINTYSDLSRPLAHDDTVQLELEELVWQGRKGRSRLVVGKQKVSWGVLDGVRITDQLSPIRLREGVASDVRPERLSLWSARLRTKFRQFDVDAVWAPDPTVNQVALNGDEFARSASRFLGGFQQPSSAVQVRRSTRDEFIDDAVYSVRVGKQLSGVDAHFVAISGPDHSPLFRFIPSVGPIPVINLEHERRALLGVDAVRPVGDFVIRAEFAVSPNRLFNTNRTGLLGEVRRDNWVIGGGFDWAGPADTFLNVQLIFDHVSDAPEGLIRPVSDIISTVTARRAFNNDVTELRVELIHSWSDGDSFARLKLNHQYTDAVTIGLKSDLFRGDKQGIFGQFRDKSRVGLFVERSF